MNKKNMLLLGIGAIIFLGIFVIIIMSKSPEIDNKDLEMIETLTSGVIMPSTPDESISTETHKDTIEETTEMTQLQEETEPVDNLELTEIIENSEVLEEQAVAPEEDLIYNPSSYVEPIIEDPNFTLRLEEILPCVYDPNNRYGVSEYDCYLLAKILELEGGDDYIVLEHKCLVVSVMLNRLLSDRFWYADSIEKVIYAEGQYYPESSLIFQNTIPRDSNLRIVYWVVNNGVICPPNVCYQANFSQGSGNYKIFYVPILGNYTYFCYE